MNPVDEMIHINVSCFDMTFGSGQFFFYYARRNRLPLINPARMDTGHKFLKSVKCAAHVKHNLLLQNKSATMKMLVHQEDWVDHEVS